MRQKQSLKDLQEGEIAKVLDILATGSMRRRLLDLGFIEGTPIRCLQKSPAGDPVAYAIRGAIIALRGEDSGDVLVVPVR